MKHKTPHKKREKIVSLTIVSIQREQLPIKDITGSIVKCCSCDVNGDWKHWLEPVY